MFTSVVAMLLVWLILSVTLNSFADTEKLAAYVKTRKDH